MKAHEKTRRLTGLALMTAIIVVLQVVASFVKFGPFSITLALAPIIIGAALYGASAGAWLGGVFGVVVFIACVAGWDAGGNILFTANPLLTCILCITAGVVCPGVNTGIFCIGLSFGFHNILVAWAGGTDLVYYIIFGLTGVNFLLELIINLVLSTVIVRVVAARKHA